MSKHIDILPEDPVIRGQKYVLLSIVGPHMRQKCDVWGLKVKGVVDSMDEARELTSKFMKADNTFDIYTAEVGKFFPLTVEPCDVEDIEYENKQLNMLMKNYMENKKNANILWEERKAKMMNDAAKEGTKEEQEKALLKGEHAVSVLQKKLEYNTRINELKSELNDLESLMKTSSDKYLTFTEEERTFAEKEIGVKNTLINEVEDEVSDILMNLQIIEKKIEECNDKIELENLNEKKNNLKSKLNDTGKDVNEFINNSYKSGAHDSLFN